MIIKARDLNAQRDRALRIREKIEGLKYCDKDKTLNTLMISASDTQDIVSALEEFDELLCILIDAAQVNL